MKRNMELIRQLCFEFEKLGPKYNDQVWSNTIQLADYSSDEIAYHVLLMNEAGFIDAYERTGTALQQTEFLVNRLTWRGHDFIESVRNETLWKKIKDKLGATIQSVSFEVFKQLVSHVSIELLGIGQK